MTVHVGLCPKDRGPPSAIVQLAQRILLFHLESFPCLPCNLSPILPSRLGPDNKTRKRKSNVSCTKTCTDHAQNMHKICTKHAQNMHKICTKYAQNMHKICKEVAKGMHIGGPSLKSRIGEELQGRQGKLSK